MTYADIILPSGVRRIVESSIDACWRGRRALVARYGRPSEMARSNMGAFADLGWALTRVRRLAKILRYVFVILATWVDVKLRTAGALAGSGGSAGKSVAGEGAGGPSHNRPRFAVGTPYRIHNDDTPLQPQPPQFANREPNKLRTLARRIEALTQALLDPMPHVRRLARRLRRDICYIAGVAPKRPPRTDRREFLDYLDEARTQARFELRQRRWVKRQDSS